MITTTKINRKLFEKSELDKEIENYFYLAEIVTPLEKMYKKELVPQNASADMFSIL